MIKSFRSRRTEALFKDGRAKAFRSIRAVALRKLDMLDAATRLIDLRVPPSNRLEALKGDRKGQYSIRVNNQWRICFVWRDGHVHDVELVDYH